ncbi:hypothetical protein IZ6_09170 [Terrihabitans soli]|uniref:Outer membrane beta-barrel protein n=1 Tax=Terrihabitans soli TaxID=708113 RepID=A0A6S6QSC9_9HYPH|nr:hypothetical protein [Terrihabitans soli]BCJ90182.1 hypothetical protein IZ6_09170 [Terrihabitans soli]
MRGILAAAALAVLVMQTSPGAAQEAGFSIGFGGDYRHVDLPDLVGLGIVPPDGAGEGDRHFFDLDDENYFGFAEYVFAEGTFDQRFGSRVRLAFRADWLESEGTSYAETRSGEDTARFISLSGDFSGVYFCDFGPCVTKSDVELNYESRTLEIDAKSDFEFGRFVLTPSLGIKAGRSKLAYEYLQELLYTDVSGEDLPYDSGLTTGVIIGTKIDSWDAGITGGLETRFDLTDHIALGVSGKFGLLYRTADLWAYDEGLGSISWLGAIEDEDGTFAVQAAPEVSLSLHNDGLAVTGFAGLQFDSGVPQIEPSDGVEPAHLGFENALSYYAGAKLTGSF